jgi:hypothetical protein
MPLLGKTTPRIFSPPLARGRPGPCGCGCALTRETSKGFSAVDFAEQVLGMTLIPWQRWLLIHALELRADGNFRFRTVLILIARQNGKTTIVEIKNLWKMFVEEVSLIISVAQELDVAEESWDNAVAIVEGIPELDAELKDIVKVNGKKALVLRSGSRWKPKAAGRRPGRGLSGDDVNLDELREHQTYDAWAAVTKTTLARPNPQVWAFSNAGDDKSIVLNELRELAVGAIDNPENADGSFGIFEWSAPDHIKCTCIEKGPGRPHDRACLLRDEQAIAQANPSLGYTITLEAVLAALATDPEAIYRTEVLCQRVESLEDGIITPAAWAAVRDPGSRRDGDLSFGVDIGVLRDWASITVYGARADGLGHGQLIDYRPGVEWVVPRLKELKAELGPLGIGMLRGTYESLKADLDIAGIKVPKDPDKPRRGDLLVLNAVDNSAACGQIIDAVRQKTMRAVPATQLDDAVLGAVPRTTGDTIAWARKDSTAEISPLGSLTAARFTHLTRSWLGGKKRGPAPPMPKLDATNNLFRPTGRLKI